MYPHERSLVRRLADKPFTIIGVNSDKDLGKLRKVVKEKSLTWRSFQNDANEEKISTTWNIKGWPTTYLIDKDGKIRYKNLRGDALDEALEELMAEMGEEVELVGIDHEAEDKAALKAAKEAKEAEEAKAKEAEDAKAEKAKDDSKDDVEQVDEKTESSTEKSDDKTDKENSEKESADKKDKTDK